MAKSCIQEGCNAVHAAEEEGGLLVVHARKAGSRLPTQEARLEDGRG